MNENLKFFSKLWTTGPTVNKKLFKMGEIELMIWYTAPVLLTVTRMYCNKTMKTILNSESISIVEM